MADMSQSDLRTLLQDAAEIQFVASLVSERVQRQRLTPWKPNLAVVVDAIQFVRLICAMSVPSHKRSLRLRPSREDSPRSGLSAFER